jgi:hyperosmotically inducible protein
MMKKHFLMLGLVGLALVSCENRHDSTTTTAADNTGRNVRDRSGTTYTADNQSESSADRTLTQEIRRAIMDQSELSTNAKNIKIITIDANVILRGPVASEREKSLILNKIRQIKGINNLDDQLEIAPSSSN